MAPPPTWGPTELIVRSPWGLSASVSLARTATSTAAFSRVVAVSATATGGDTLNSDVPPAALVAVAVNNSPGVLAPRPVAVKVATPLPLVVTDVDPSHVWPSA